MKIQIEIFGDTIDALFFCPGCKEIHSTRTSQDGPYHWEWNGSIDNPTFSPSLLNRWEEGVDRTPKVCHSFVRDGKLEFLGDCTHELAGKTIDMIEFEGSVFDLY